MANDATNITVAGSGSVHIAPVGTTLPTGVATNLDAAFLDLGYITEDGVSFTKATDVGDIMAWQSDEAVRRIVNSRTYTAAFELEEWNDGTLALAWDATAVTVSGGVRLDLPEAGDALGEWSMVIELVDGTRTGRIVIPRGNVDGDVESQFQRSEAAVLPIEFKALTPTAGGAAVIPYFSDSDAYAS